MKLIGMSDSPFVRRVGISLKLMDQNFEHLPLSVFTDFDAFSELNPLVKAPTLIADDGTALVDSTLILEYLERLAGEGKSLQPSEPAAFLLSQRIIGLSLIACEKAVQIVYEYRVRPEEIRFAPWLERVQGQLEAACGHLEALIPDGNMWFFGDEPMQADITAAVAWRFVQETQAQRLSLGRFPKLSAFSAVAEKHLGFIAFPYVD